MASGAVCYHHRNRLDVPAVGSCSVCGKGLCKECFDKFKSPSTGKAVCIDCLNYELRQSASKVSGIATKLKKEKRRMIIGAIIGGALPGALLLVSLIGLLFSGDFETFFTSLLCTVYFGSIGGSFFTLIKWAWKAGDLDIFDLGFLIKGAIRIVAFFGLIAAAPVVFIIRIISKIKKDKEMIELRNYYNWRIEQNNKYLNAAILVHSGMNATQSVQVYAQEANNNKLEIEKMRKELELAQLDKRIAKAQAVTEMLKTLEEKQKNLELQQEVAQAKAENREISKGLQEQIDAVNKTIEETNKQVNILAEKDAEMGKKVDLLNEKTDESIKKKNKKKDKEE